MIQECKYGKIEFREPDVIEGFRFIASLTTDDNKPTDIVDSLEHLYLLVTKVDLNIKGKVVDSLEGLKKAGVLEIMLLLSNMRNAVQKIVLELEDEKK